MTKLSDTQMIILSRAAQKEDHIALPLPDSLRGGASAKVVGAMLTKGFLEEVDADMRKGEPVWRKTGDGHGTTLVATDAGLAAIGVEPEDANTAPAGATDAPTEEPTPDTPTQFDEMWNALIPAEQARVVRLLVARVTASDAGLAVDLRHEGLGAIAALMGPAKPEVA